MLKHYLTFALAAVSIGTMDFLLKFPVQFAELPSYMQGWSWHLIIFGIYAGFVILYSMLHGWRMLIGIIGFVNEDAIYYLYKSIVLHHFLEYNTWINFFSNYIIYYILIILINCLLVITFFLIKSKETKSNLDKR